MTLNIVLYVMFVFFILKTFDTKTTIYGFYLIFLEVRV
jgi:hypothetical protein